LEDPCRDTKALRLYILHPTGKNTVILIREQVSRAARSGGLEWPSININQVASGVDMKPDSPKNTKQTGVT